jgi:hypothetical protein
MRALLVVLALILTSTAAFAGRQCVEKPLTPEAVRKGLRLAAQVRDQLDRTDARVALVGRVGSDLSRHGLRYSHAGLVQRDHPAGRWVVLHALNTCGTPASALFEEGLGNFFFDDPFLYEAIVVVPSSPVQQRLLDGLASGLPPVLHTPSYSMIAHPYSVRYQNSNQWLLELLAASLAPAGEVGNREEAQRWLHRVGYVPSEVFIGPVQRAGARMFAVNVRFDDHSSDERASGRYRVVSVQSILRFLALRDSTATRHVVVLR